MKQLLATGAMMLALAPYGLADAAGDDSSDIVILSVIPRSPDVKPVIMTVAAPHDRGAPGQPASVTPPERDAPPPPRNMGAALREAAGGGL